MTKKEIITILGFVLIYGIQFVLFKFFLKFDSIEWWISVMILPLTAATYSVLFIKPIMLKYL